MLRRLFRAIVEQDRALQGLNAITPDSAERTAYLNATVELAKAGIRPEQITFIAHVLARGDTKPKEHE